MASPFQKYQGEQVQQINILPYTGQMYENYSRSIQDAFKTIAGGIGKYQQETEDKNKAVALASGVVNQYMEQDGPEDDATGEVTYKVSDTAPSHIKELWKKSQKQPDGVAGLATTDLTSFLTLHSKWEQDDAIRFDRKTKEAGIKVQEAQLALAEKEFGLRTTAQEQNYRFQLRDLEWRIARGEKSDKLEQDKLELAKKQFELESALGPEKVKLLQAQVRKEVAGATLVEGQVSEKLAKDELIKKSMGISPTEEVTTYGEKTIRSGVVRLPDGLYEWSDDIDQYLKDNKLKVEDLSAPAQPTAIPMSTSLARALSGDANFDPSLPAVKNNSANKKQFVQKVYEQLLANFPENKAVIDHQFRWNESAKGENKNVELDSARYDLAVKYISTKQFQEKVGSALGIKQEFAPQVPAKPPTGVEIVSETKTSFGTIKRDVFYKTEKRFVDDAYDAAYKEFAARNAVFPMTRQDAYQVFGLFGGMKRWENESGKILYTNAKGDTITEEELSSRGLTRAPLNEAQMKRQGANNWVRRYVGNGVDVGNYVIKAKTKNMDDPMAEMPIIDAEKAQKEMLEIENDISKADKYIDKMIEMWRTKPWGEVLKVFGSEWQTEYTTYQRGLETFRKHFIAPGTETEKDAMRLGDMMAEPSFWRHMQDVDKTVETLELTRSLIADSAKNKADAYGFEISSKKGFSGLSKEQASKRISEIVEALKDKYPDIYRKHDKK